jgi:hypothetical protein
LPAAAQKGSAYALVAGSIFREPGFAFPRVEVTLQAKTPPVGKKVKTQKLLTDERGEFTFRVPAEKAEYVLEAKAQGFVSETKAVIVSADERQDVFLTLKPVKP